MYIVTVTICKLGIFGEELTYRFGKQLFAGDLVQVTFRKKLEFAIVVRCIPLSNAKGLVKRSDFSVHSVDAVLCSQYVHPTVMQGLESVSLLYGIGVAKVLACIIAIPYVKSQAKYATVGLVSDLPRILPVKFDRTVMSHSYTDRLKYYASLIVKQNSKIPAIILAPTALHAQKISVDLQQILTTLKSTIVCTSVATRPPSKKESTKQNMINQTVYCVTPHTLGCFLQHVPSVFMCENENHPQYIQAGIPFIDSRIVIEHIAKAVGVAVMYADQPCSTHAYTHYGEDKNITLLETSANTITSSAQLKVYARDKKSIVPKMTKEFEIIAPALSDAILLAIKNNESLFLVTSRHGYGPSIVCKDCSSVMRCRSCAGVLVLKSVMQYTQKNPNEDSRIFMCNECKETEKPYDVCPVCTGATLAPMGIGVERITESLSALVPAELLYVRTENSKALKNITTGTSYDEKNVVGACVCVGTIYDLDNQPSDFDHVIIVSHEGMLAAPVRNIFDHQEFLGQVVRSHTKQCMHIQTQHERADLRAYTGANFYDRLTAYIKSAYEYNLSPAPSLAIILDGHPSAKEAFLSTLRPYLDIQKLTLQAHAARIEASSVKPIFTYITQYIITGFSDQKALIACINVMTKQAQAFLNMRVHYVPYPSAFKYSLKKWIK